MIKTREVEMGISVLKEILNEYAKQEEDIILNISKFKKDNGLKEKDIVYFLNGIDSDALALYPRNMYYKLKEGPFKEKIDESLKKQSMIINNYYYAKDILDNFDSYIEGYINEYLKYYPDAEVIDAEVFRDYIMIPIEKDLGLNAVNNLPLYHAVMESGYKYFDKENLEFKNDKKVVLSNTNERYNYVGNYKVFSKTFPINIDGNKIADIYKKYITDMLKEKHPEFNYEDEEILFKVLNEEKTLLIGTYYNTALLCNGNFPQYNDIKSNLENVRPNLEKSFEEIRELQLNEQNLLEEEIKRSKKPKFIWVR